MAEVDTLSSGPTSGVSFVAIVTNVCPSPATTVSSDDVVDTVYPKQDDSLFVVVDATTTAMPLFVKSVRIVVANVVVPSVVVPIT